jgi:molybdopterin molybdotransferase
VLPQLAAAIPGDRVTIAPHHPRRRQPAPRRRRPQPAASPSPPANCCARRPGLIASLGIGEVTVRRKLSVAFFSTGDELRSLGEQAR